MSWLLASRQQEAERGPHGFLMSEATSNDANPANPNRTYEFVGQLPIEDYAERAREKFKARYLASYPAMKDRTDLIWPVEKVPTQQD